MQLVKQPWHSKLCGHAVVAMILGVPLPEAVALIGHRHGTKAKELRAVLRGEGVAVSDRSTLTRYSPLPARAIVRLSRPKGGNWHWMLWWDGQMYDPDHTELPGLEDKGWKVTSFIEIGKLLTPSTKRD